jgi:hexosaminidase
MVSIRPSFKDGSEIRFTLDGSVPSRSSGMYAGPFMITQASHLRAAAFHPGSDKPEALTEARFATALYAAPRYNTPFAARWAGSGIYNLVDGQRGEFWTDGFWQGFEYDNLDVSIDLGQTREISEISLGSLQYLPSWIFLPVEVEFFLSIEGQDFVSAGKIITEPELERIEDVIREYSVRFAKQPARYVRVLARNLGVCPDWHVGAGGRAWIFADEITVK